MGANNVKDVEHTLAEIANANLGWAGGLEQDEETGEVNVTLDGRFSLPQLHDIIAALETLQKGR